jgi:hypothetical protein
MIKLKESPLGDSFKNIQNGVSEGTPFFIY